MPFARTRSPLKASFVLAILLSSGILSSASAAERFNLSVPGNAALRSSAVLDGNTLTITDGGGQSFVYVRTPRFDSPDGTLLGFFSKGANQSMRWPANGVGKFLIGDPQGLQFRESRMTIAPVANPNPVPNPLPRDVRKPGLPPPIPVPPGGNVPGNVPGVRQPARPVPGQPAPPVVGVPGLRPRPRAPVEIALLPGANDTLTAAFINASGQLEVYEGWEDTWKRRTIPLREPLVPGAPLVLRPGQKSAFPSVFTIGARGELLHIVGGGEKERELSKPDSFIPGTHLESAGTPQFPALVGVTRRGRIQYINLRDAQFTPIEMNPDRYDPGSPLTVIDAGDQELFLIDRLGTLVNYRNAGGRWGGPDPIARGFQSGAQVAAALMPELDGGADLIVAAVDALGRLQAFRLTQNGWADLPLGSIQLPPGAPVSIVRSADGLHISGVTRNGDWIDWTQERRGLVPQVVGRGFPPGAPVILYAHERHLHGVCVDSAGRFVAATRHRGEWTSVLGVPEFDLAPRLVKREIVPGDPLPPVTVQLENRHNEPLIVKVIDELGGGEPVEQTIAAGRSIRQTLQRDAAGTLEEVWMVPTQGGQWVQDVRRTPLPPQPRYRVVVYANRTTYSYVDKRTKPGPVKNFDMQSPVSLGAFRIPPGAEVQDGETFDVYREAVARQNAGAAAAVDPQGP